MSNLHAKIIKSCSALAIASLPISVFAANSVENIAITWPTAVVGKVVYNPVLIYQCKTTACKSVTRQDKKVFVSAIPKQPKYGLSGTPPAPITFLSTNGQATSFKIFRASTQVIGSNTQWGSCVLSMNADGSLNHSLTTCQGAVVTSNSTSTVSALSFMAGNFTVTMQTPPGNINDLLQNPIPARSITFVNDSAYSELCLSLNSKFMTKGQSCSDIDGIVLTKKKPYTLIVSGKGADADKGGGSMSGAAFVVGFKDNGVWQDTGRYKNTGLVYATAMEWSMLPAAPVKSVATGMTDHSIGVTTIDISAVNGYNLGASLKPDEGTVCSTASRDSKGNAEPAQFSYYGTTFSKLPAQGVDLQGLCPSTAPFPGINTTQVVTNSQNETVGCLSPCKYATYLNSIGKLPSYVNLPAVCCDGNYDNSQLCTATKLHWGSDKVNIAHEGLPYVANLAAPNTQQVYRWQFDDYKGTFSCDPKASFTFTLH